MPSSPASSIRGWGRTPTSGGGRREEAVPGTELLVRWTWCANGDPTCQPAPVAVPPQPVPAGIAPRLARHLAQVRRNSALIALVCGGNLLCQGQLELLIGSAATAAAAKPRRIVYGRAS